MSSERDENSTAEPSGGSGHVGEVIEPLDANEQYTATLQARFQFPYGLENSVVYSAPNGWLNGRYTFAQYQLPQDRTSAGRHHRANSQSQSVLFTLPAELRLQIYEHALSVERETVLLVAPHFLRKYRQRVTVLMLLETCRRIHAEAEPIFYRVNRLELPNSAHAGVFFSTVSQTRREAIRSMAIYVWSDYEQLHFIRAIAPASGVRHLRINRACCEWHMEKSIWSRFADDIAAALRELKELRGLEITSPRLPVKTPAVESKRRELKELDDKLIASLGFQ